MEEKRKPPPRKDGSATQPKLGAPAPIVAPMTGADEYDVEIVGAAPPVAPPKPPGDDDERSLLELDRRDYIMAGAGGGIVALAILMGYGISRLLRGSSSTASTPAESPSQQEPPRSTYRRPPVEKPPDETKKDDDPKDEMKKGEAKAD
jgi:hypothetical protein